MPTFMQNLQSTIERNDLLAQDTYRIRLHCPEIAQAIRPGQFVMLRLPGTSDPLLGRPFALYDTILDHHQQPQSVDIVYLVIGKLTGLLANLNPREKVELWGPLGNGFFDPPEDSHIGLIAGGIGQTPFLAYIRDLLGNRGYGNQQPRKKASRVSVYYGVRSGELLAGVEDFEAAGAEVHLATDDGSAGFHGFVTQLLEENLNQPHRPTFLVGCGPEPMLHALAKLAGKHSIPCQVSLETPMACGIGVCFSCVTEVKTADGWDYRRVCVDGPVFDCTALNWN